MRYVFLTTGPWAGNASFERLYHFGAQLLARGVEVGFVVDDLPGNRAMKLPAGAEVAFASPGGIKQVLSRRRAIRKLRPDFVHALNPAPKAVAALKGTRWKLIGDWDEWSEMRSDHRFPAWLERYIAKWFRRRAAVTVVCSRYMQSEFLSRYELAAHYIPYAADVQAPLAESPSPFDKPTAVYMGSLHAQFDHDIMFEAARLLAREGKRPEIAVIGGGPEVEKWREFVREKGLSNVTVKGRVSDSDRDAHLKHAHVLLFPIRPTPGNLARCPFKVFAYGQARRPTITCRVGEVPQTFGEVATYVEPTPEAFARAIDEAMHRDQPDVDYQIERQNWSARTDALLEAIVPLQPKSA